MLDAVQQATPEGIAAAGRIGDPLGRHDRNLLRALLVADGRAVLAARNDEGVDPAGDFIFGPSRLVAHQLGLVVVDRYEGRKFNAAAQRRTVEQRQALARIEHERHPGPGEFFHVLHHPVEAVGADDRELDARRVARVVQVRLHHRARVERRDLVVVEIGRDHRLRRISLGQHANVIAAQAELLEPVEIRLRVERAYRPHDARIAAEQVQRVRDVARAAAEFAAHRRHQEAQVDEVHLVGQDVLAEPPLESHDGIVGDRAANQRSQGVRSCRNEGPCATTPRERRGAAGESERKLTSVRQALHRSSARP